MKSVLLPKNLAPIYTRIDTEIRAGNFERARDVLSEVVHHAEVAREEAPWLAELYRRVGQSEMGTRLLFRYVNPSALESAQIRATDHELAEYGGGLIRLYAVREAERVLARLPDTDSRKFYFLAFARIHEWDYAAALALLRKHETLSPASPYVSLVARVNLADCLVETGSFAEAKNTLEDCLRKVRAADAKLLEANTLELIAKNHVYAGETAPAERAIAEARRFLGEAASGTADAYFLERLERILELRSGHRSARTRLFDFQSRAKQAGQFEIARDVELQLAQYDRDERRYHSLYFGTPFPAYRQKIAASAQRNGIEIPKWFLWSPPCASGQTSVFTERSPFVPSEHFKPGALLERLFLALAADFYRPRRLLEIYEAAYPGQSYNPVSSRDQIHQGLLRLRKTMKKDRLPFEVSEKRETYTVLPKAAATILLHEVWTTETSYLDRLRCINGHFSSREASDRLGCSKNTAISILNRLKAKGEIKQTGSGPRVRYLLEK